MVVWYHGNGGVNFNSDVCLTEKVAVSNSLAFDVMDAEMQCHDILHYSQVLVNRNGVLHSLDSPTRARGWCSVVGCLL